MRSLGIAPFLVLAATALFGCATGSLGPDQLHRLDGYDAKVAGQSEREVETITGDKLTFSREASLYLDLPNERVGGHFESIRVQNGLFEGRAVDVRQIRAPLGEVRAATLEQLRPGTVAALVIVGVLAAAGLLLLVSVGSNESAPGGPFGSGALASWHR